MKDFKLFLLSLSFGALVLTGCKDEWQTEEDKIMLETTLAEETRAKFLGTYNVSESCESGNYTFSLTVTTSSTGVRNVIINNFYDIGIAVNGTVTGNSLNIPNQTVTSGGTALTISGSGQITGNILTMTYTISAGAESDTCTATCTKQ